MTIAPARRLLALASSAAAVVVTAGAAAGAPVPAGTTAAVVEQAQARAAPRADGRPLGVLSDRMPWSARRQTLMVTAISIDGADRPWYRVQLPTRPNGRTAWVDGSQLVLGRTPYEIRILTRSRRLQLLYEGRQLLSVPAGVGTSATPTPTGTFALHDMLPPPPGTAAIYGRHVLALTAYSPVVQMILGGDARIAIHGTTDPARIGAPVTNGCVVLGAEALDYLWRTVGPGTRVRIVRR